MGLCNLDILGNGWPPGKGCDTTALFQEVIERLADFLCNLYCEAIEIRVVPCGTPQNIWQNEFPNCTVLPAGHIIIELCACPIFWVWDGTAWVQQCSGQPDYAEGNQSFQFVTLNGTGGGWTPLTTIHQYNIPVSAAGIAVDIDMSFGVDILQFAFVSDPIDKYEFFVNITGATTNYTRTYGVNDNLYDGADLHFGWSTVSNGAGNITVTLQMRASGTAPLPGGDDWIWRAFHRFSHWRTMTF